jgi:hypothetical protein
LRLDDDCRGLGWAHGCLAVQRLGAMLGPLTFVLRDGRQVSPLHVAPWADEAGGEALPGVLRRLRGEWPCVPFGYSLPPDGFPPAWAAVMPPGDAHEEVHGHCSNHDWSWEPAADAGELRLSLLYPGTSPVRRVERRIRADTSAPRSISNSGSRRARPAGCPSACTRSSTCPTPPGRCAWSRAGSITG